jgi:hypothetical protein
MPSTESAGMASSLVLPTAALQTVRLHTIERRVVEAEFGAANFYVLAFIALKRYAKQPADGLGVTFDDNTSTILSAAHSILIAAASPLGVSAVTITSSNCEASFNHGIHTCGLSAVDSQGRREGCETDV